MDRLTQARCARTQLPRYSRGAGKHVVHYREMKEHAAVHWVQELHDMWYSQPSPFMLSQDVIVARGLGAGVDVSMAKQVARDLTTRYTVMHRLLCKMVANSHLVLGDTEYWLELSHEYEQARLALETVLEGAMDAVLERYAVPKCPGQCTRRVATKQTIIQALHLNLAGMSASSKSSSETSSLASSSSCGVSPCLSPRKQTMSRSVPASPRNDDVNKPDKVRDRKKRISMPAQGAKGPLFPFGKETKSPGAKPTRATDSWLVGDDTLRHSSPVQAE